MKMLHEMWNVKSTSSNPELQNISDAFFVGIRLRVFDSGIVLIICVISNSLLQVYTVSEHDFETILIEDSQLKNNKTNVFFGNRILFLFQTITRNSYFHPLIVHILPIHCVHLFSMKR